MNADKKLRVRKPHVVGESFEDEAVIVNLQTGIYYSLNEPGMWLWDKIDEGIVSNQLFEDVNDLSCDLSAAIQVFVQELIKEELIEVTDEASTQAEISIPDNLGVPKFEKFSDMQDLLLLDPIHDVDETGWPKKAENSENKEIPGAEG